MTHDSTSVKQIKEAKLADGSVTRIGLTPVAPEWKCRQLDKKSQMVALDKLKGLIKLYGQFEALKDEAIDYANQKNLKPNYIFLYAPSENSVNGFDLAPLAESSASFYACKNPPAMTNKIF